MNTKFSFVLVGLFVLLLGGVMVAGVLWLAGGGSGRAYDEYVVYMSESVSGLSRDSTVKYHGVGVGSVRGISLDPDNPERVKLLLHIDQGTPIREDTTATLEFQGLTGLAYINLDGGSQSSPALRAVDNEDLPIIPSLPSIWGRLDHSVGALIDNLIVASDQVNRLLNDDNQNNLTDSLAHINVLSGTLANRTDVLVESLDDLSATIRNARMVSEQLPEMLSQMINAAHAMERMANQIGNAGVIMRDTVEATGRDLTQFTGQTLPEATALINELRQTAVNLRRFSDQLERNPSVLLYGKPLPIPGPGE